jgi:hypothetical protein
MPFATANSATVSRKKTTVSGRAEPVQEADGTPVRLAAGIERRLWPIRRFAAGPRRSTLRGVKKTEERRVQGEAAVILAA